MIKWIAFASLGIIIVIFDIPLIPWLLCKLNHHQVPKKYYTPTLYYPTSHEAVLRWTGLCLRCHQNVVGKRKKPT
jgi:hypothetical protein